MSAGAIVLKSMNHEKGKMIKELFAAFVALGAHACL
jgi:hypothetical protein